MNSHQFEIILKKLEEINRKLDALNSNASESRVLIDKEFKKAPLIGSSGYYNEKNQSEK